jgi:hypothetical protein
LIAPTTIQIPKDALPGAGGHGLSNINIGEVLSVTLTFATSTGQGLLDFLITFVSTVYLLLDGHHLVDGLQRFAPPRERPRLNKVMERIRKTWSSYIRAQIFLAGLMAFVSWLVLQFIFHLQFAVPVALAVGLLETVPIVGPLIALTLAGVVSLATGGLLQTVFVILALYGLRLLEDHAVIPYVLGRAIHLPAIDTLFAVTVAGVVAGLVGVLLAVPIAAALKVVLDEYYPHPNSLPPEETALLHRRKPLPRLGRRRHAQTLPTLATGPHGLHNTPHSLHSSVPLAHHAAPVTTHLPEPSEPAPQASSGQEHAANGTEAAVLEQATPAPARRSRKKNTTGGV